MLREESLNGYQAKLDSLFAELKKRYEGKELPQTIRELKESNTDLENIQNIGPWIERAFDVHASDYLIELGIIREKKPEKEVIKKQTTEEKLADITEELKKRIAEDGERVLATDGKEIVEGLKARYPDLQIQTINSWIKKVYPGENIKSYLIHQGIIQTVRECCISRIEHVDNIDLSKDKLFMEEEDPDIQILLQNMGKTRALVISTRSWEAEGYLFVLDTEDNDPMEGALWDDPLLLKKGYIKKFVSKANVIEVLNNKLGKKKAKKSFTASEEHPVESFCLENFNPALYEAFLKKLKVSDRYFKEVNYKDSDHMVPVFVVECAVVPYMQQLMNVPTKIGDYQKDYTKFTLVPKADKVAEAFDRESFEEMLGKLIGPDMPSVYHTLVPFGRYASGKQISGLVSRMNKWRNWDAYSVTGRKSIMIARGSILLNDSREAMLYADKAGAIGYYAGLRNMDADVMRDQIMSNFGLDKDGKKVFDLGSTTIEVSVDKELKLSLYDTANDKVVKSIPKRGADLDKYEKAKTDFADIKKNLKEIVKNRTELLFGNFLGGRTREPESWKKSYLNNFILHKVGELVVWDQKGKTFILTETSVINCFGDNYEINDKEPIGVAHPVNMNAVEIQCWQRYFTSHGLKQPFEQVWEPVIDMEKFKPDRYKGRMIPYYRFLKKEKEGIYVYDRDFHNEIEIRLIGCKADIYRVDFERHQIDMNHRFEVEKITVSKPSRISNHILAYLDRITMVDRVIADDVTLLQTLHDLSYAQIMDYIKIANENNAVNVLAGLMDYKESNYSDFDPMDEFVLD